MSKGDSSDPFRKSVPLGDENPFRDNPYASPDLRSGDATVGPGPSYLPSSRRGMVRHVPIVAVLMIVQGCLEVVMGLGLVGLGAVLPRIMQSEMARQGQPPEVPDPETMSWILLAVYGFLGLLVLSGAVLHILAGIRNYMFRSRMLGIVALIAGMVTTLITCYCAPTAVALGVYGLVCYLNPEVTHVFGLVAAGKTKDEILGSFG